ncbi:MAG: hypothetical protein KDA58_10420 [Planctomycetaceae bacterium]|nr:hypothetical protein [Planctomycetaceae bacterium]
MRPVLLLSVCAATLAGLAGCANLMTKQAIERFSAGIEEQDLDALREHSSNSFEHKALRTAAATQDLRILKVPTGKFRIEEVERVSDHTRRVVVSVGEKQQARRLEYRLTRDRSTAQWVVDDLTLDPLQDGQSPPSIAEQMDLLLSARNFLDVWKGEDRDQKLQACTQELRESLETLPPAWFGRLTEQTLGDGRQRTVRPEARMNGDLAVVVVPHPEGELFIELKKQDTWQVNDAAVQPKNKTENGIPSIKKLALTLNRTAEFLSSYAAVEREGLQATSTPKFFDRCLSAADLATVPLPVADLLLDGYELRHYTDRRELLLEAHDITYMLSLQSTQSEAEVQQGKDPRYLVDEVTIFEQGGDQVKRVSAMFLSHAVVQLYGEALSQRDLHSLKKLSSPDFNARVWDQESAELFTVMPLPEFTDPEVKIISTIFRGDATEVTVSQGARAETFVLALLDGLPVVDDVVLPSTTRPTSLKRNLELLLPMYAFASSLYREDLPGLLRYSADGLDRIVWRQVDHVPVMEADVVSSLMLGVSGIESAEPWSVIRLGNDEAGAEIKLVREGNRFVVHDLGVWDNNQLAARFEMLPTLRHRLATGEIPTRTYGTKSRIMQVSGEEIVPADAEDASVIANDDSAEVEAAAPRRRPSPIESAIYEAVVPE